MVTMPQAIRHTPRFAAIRFVLLLILLLATACRRSETPEVDLAATVAAAVEATRAAEPTVTPMPPTSTPLPPTLTPAPPPAAPIPPTPTPEPIVEIPSHFTLYVDPDGYFEIKLPEAWKINPAAAAVVSMSPDNKALIGVLGLPGETILNNQALQKYGENFLANFSKGGQVNIDRSQLALDGSMSYEFTIASNDQALKGILFVEQRGLDIFHLIIVAKAALWPQYQEAFARILASYLVTPEKVAAFLSPPLALVAYADPEALFSLALPGDWTQDAAQGVVAVSVPGEQSLILAVGRPVDFDLEALGAEKAATGFMSAFYQGRQFVIDRVEERADGGFGVSYTVDADGNPVSGFMRLQQQGQHFYLLLLQAQAKDWFGLQETFNNVLTSYVVNAPEPSTSLLSPSPAPTAAPEVNPLAPEPGRSRLYVFNEIGEELTFTINNQEFKVPASNFNDPTPIDLNPGKYTYTLSIPSGGANGEIELGADQSWAVGMRGDYIAYIPFQLYP